jgi:flagellar basal-body rod protein FlgF
MSDIYQIANIGLLDARQRVEAISLNAASASLHGYRRHVVTGRAFATSLAEVAEPGSSTVTGSRLGDVAAISRQHQVNLQRGAMISTGRALDLAIDADDLFFALTDGTQTWLTRAGDFRLDADSTLVGEGGLRVVGTQGDLRLPGTNVAVTSDGRIMHEGLLVGTVQLFRPNEPASLQAARGALLIAPFGMQPADAGVGRIRSGTLEASNTDASREMLSLLAVSRQFESLSRVLQSYDELLGRTIQKLGEV